MPPIQHSQLLPSFNLALRPDQHKTILPNFSYPSRPIAHVPWSGSSAPLLFVKTTRPEMTIATVTPNVPVPPTAIMCCDTCSVLDTFHGISMSIWHMIVRKLKLIGQRFLGVRTTSPSVAAGV
ncbi:hypothetical protein BYT27DRAFT_7261513 [Phlegmacium glaucopus]|nr:hypothetical protein BYT27DRAFT_7261513 [Phlegmacium glaucopus]